MKFKKLLMLLLAFAIMFAFSLTATADAPADFTGWQYEDVGGNTERVYYVNGVMVTGGWYQIENEWYYFGGDGIPYRGNVYEIDGVLYGFNYNGIMYDDEHFFFSKYSEDLGYFVETWYCAKPGGALFKDSWAKPTYTCEGVENTKWYYAGPDYVLLMGKQYIGGKYYYFDENRGEMFYDQTFGKYDEASDDVLFYYAQGGAHDGALAQNTWATDDDGDWVYYKDNCARAENEVVSVGGTLYAFGYDSKMFSGEIAEVYNHETESWDYYYALESGALLTNGWCQPHLAEHNDDTWYYCGADGKFYTHGLYNIGGKNYCFTSSGSMLENGSYSFYENDVRKFFIADKDGNACQLFNNTWTQFNGDWYYVQDNELCDDGVYLIDGKNYAFRWDGKMYDNEFFYLSIYDDDWNYLGEKCYYAKPGGVLAQNEVLYISRYGDKDYFLFGEDCSIPEESGLYVLNGVYYYMWTDYGRVYCNGVQEFEEGVFLFGEDGKGTKLSEGWNLNNTSSYSEYWVYVQDGALLKDGIYQLGANSYAFDYDGELLTDRVYYDDASGKQYLLTYMDEYGNGGSVCKEKNVWKTVNGNYVYLTEDSSLHRGWLFDVYYMDPYMSYCTFIVDKDYYVSAVNTQGIATKLTTTRFLTINGDTYYIREGKLVAGDWVYDNGYWYFFSGEGNIFADTTTKIKGVYYYFDINGRMCNSGWVRDSYGNWYWAAADGSLFTGLDSSGYVFSSSGKLFVDNITKIDDVWYVTDINGKLIGSFSEEGWNQVGNDWYLVKTYDDEYDSAPYKDYVTGSYYAEDGRFFAFDHQGRMLSNQFYDDYYLGSNGDALKGWFFIDGYWYYGNPEDHGYLYARDVYDIGNKEYAFNSKGQLIQNQTFYSWNYDALVTTNSDGEVISKTAANGWVYSHDNNWNEGEVYYFVNGESYDGWLGNYYIDNGSLVINRVIYDYETEKHYCLDKKGLLISNGWYERYENDWVYANADGSLVEDDWLYSGNTWYYFDGYSMVYDQVMEIDGAYHKFAESGAWLGEVASDDEFDFSNMADGWVQLNGNWYFSMAGEAIIDETLYIDGEWYYFDEDGIMVSSRFANVNYYKYDGFAYYTSSGARAEYTGWQFINNNWVYFNDSSFVNVGWVLDGGKYYYQEVSGAFKNPTLKMITGYKVINNQLHYFNDGGVLTETITSYGWHQVGSDWYFVGADGKVVTEEAEYLINGAYYAFDYDGIMVSNDIWNGKYYNAGGVLVTNPGWYVVDGQWIYVTETGDVAGDGVYLIGGREYYFHNYFWVG